MCNLAPLEIKKALELTQLCRVIFERHCVTVSRTRGFTVLAHYVHDTEHASAFTHFSLKQEHPSWGETAAHRVSGLHTSV